MVGLQKFNSFLSAIRFYGVAEFCRVYGFKAVGIRRIILVALSVPRPLTIALEKSESHTFHFASVGELLDLKSVKKYEISDLDIDHSNKGAKCLIQKDGEKVVGFAWVWANQLAPIVDGIHINLPDDTIYNYKSYTDPEYRGYGFQALRHLKLLNLLKVDGAKRLFGYVDDFNTKSLKGVQKSGYKKVGELRVSHRKSQSFAELRINKNFWASEVRI